MRLYYLRPTLPIFLFVEIIVGFFLVILYVSAGRSHEPMAETKEPTIASPSEISDGTSSNEPPLETLDKSSASDDRPSFQNTSAASAPSSRVITTAPFSAMGEAGPDKVNARESASRLRLTDSMAYHSGPRTTSSSSLSREVETAQQLVAKSNQVATSLQGDVGNLNGNTDPPSLYGPRRIPWHQGFTVEQEWYRSWFGWGASPTPTQGR